MARRTDSEGNVIRTFYRLMGSDGRVFASAGQRWILEIDINQGWTHDTNEKDELVVIDLPEGCVIVEIEEG